MNNVIDISKNPKIQDSLEDMRAQGHAAKEEFACEISEELIEMVVGWMSQYGLLSINRETTDRDIAAIQTAIESCVCRYLGVNHPFQEVADAFVQHFESEEHNDSH